MRDQGTEQMHSSGFSAHKWHILGLVMAIHTQTHTDTHKRVRSQTQAQMCTEKHILFRYTHTHTLTDLQLSLNAALAALPVVGLRGVVL